MNPGATTRSWASISRTAVPSIVRPIAAIESPLIAISPRYHGPPVPSMIRALRMMTSKSAAFTTDVARMRMDSKVLGSMRGVYIAAMNKRALLPSLMLVLSCGANEPGVQSATEIAREVTTGMRSRARVQVSVKASAEDPGQEDLDLRKKIEDRIEQQNIGRLVSSGGGAGF